MVNGPHQSHGCLTHLLGEGGIFSLSTLAYVSTLRCRAGMGVIWTARRGQAVASEEGGSHGTDQSVSWAAQAWAVEQHPGSGVRKSVLLALAYCANHETNLCNPRVATLCGMTDYSDRAVRDALALLETEGYIGRVRERHDDGTYGHYHYSFPALTPAASPADGTDPDQRRLPPVAPPASPAGQELEVDLEPEPLPSEASTAQDGLFVVQDASEGRPLSINGGTNGAVAEVYAYWCEQRGKTRSNYRAISPKRKDIIGKRLKEFTVDDLRHAIDGVGCDPWPDRKQHDDLTIIFRSQEQVDKFLELWRNRPKPRAPADDLFARNVGKTKLGRRKQP